MKKEKGRWITVKGTHVFIKDGQTVGEAIEEMKKRPLTGPENFAIMKKGNSTRTDSQGFYRANTSYAEILSMPKAEESITLSIYVNSNDDVYRYAKNITPIEGYEDQVIHGDKYGFEIRDLNDNVSSAYTPEEFAEILKEDPNYHGGNIRLISCSSGVEDGNAAQALADALGVDVLAPTKDVFICLDGSMKVGENNEGRWILYKKR